MTTLYIRIPARAESEGTPSGFALVADGGSVMQKGAGALKGLGDLIAQARRVVLLLAASDVTLLHLKVPPLPAAKLKAALPGLVEEHILGDPADCVLAAVPLDSADGMRTIAVVARHWFEAEVKAVIDLGARAVSALPLQLCLPYEPGNASALIGPHGITVRTGLHEGAGIAMDASPDDARATAQALAGELPLTVYEVDQWEHLVAGSKSTTFDLAPALGSAGAPQRDWTRWRWPLRIAALAVLVNIVGLNVEWLRMKRESDALRQSNLQVFRSAFPKETAIQDPVLQMRVNLARARTASGQVGPEDYTYMTAMLGMASAALQRKPEIASLEFNNGVMDLKLKPDTIDANTFIQVQQALKARGLTVSEAGPGAWQIRAGAKP